MAGDQEHRLRSLIAGNRLDEAIDDELDQWLNAQTRLHEVGAALIEVSTPVSENFGADTVKGALDAFKAVGEKVKERADDIQQVHDALKHAVTVTRAAQKVVVQMDGDTREKPEFPPSKPGDDETDEIHDLKVYSGQMNLYNSWSTERETTSQQHADKVETAWKDAIAVMEKIPDDEQPGGGTGGGPAGAGAGGGPPPDRPGRRTDGPVPTDAVLARRPPRRRPRRPPHHPVPAGAADTEGPHPAPQPVPTDHPPPSTRSRRRGGYGPRPPPPRRRDPDGGLDPYPGGTPYGPTGPIPSGGVGPDRRLGLRARSAAWPSAARPVPVSSAVSLPACARPARPGAGGGLRSGGVLGTLGASGRTAGSARGALGPAAAAAAPAARPRAAPVVAARGAAPGGAAPAVPAVPGAAAARTRTRRSASPRRSSCSTRTASGSTTRARAPE